MRRFLAPIGLLGGGLLVASCGLVLGIGDPSLDPTGAGGSGGRATTSSTMETTSSTVTSGPGTTTATTGGTGGMGYPCTPTDPACNVGNADCVPLIDNAALPQFTLRIGQIDFFKPDAFTGTFEKAAFLSSVTLPLAACNLKGSGTFSWLVNLDPAGGKYTVGASKPPADPLDGYSFVDEMIMQDGKTYHIAPFGGGLVLDADGTVHADGVDYVVMPIYLDAKATNFFLIPIHKVRLYETKISSDHNCIGHYNAEGLKAQNGCLPDVNQNLFSFVDGGKLDGFITLEEADAIILQSFGLNRSLCVLLSNAASIFGDGGSPAKCKRDGNNQIKFPGDWCAATNGGADPSCYDAMQFNVGFAASAAKLNP